MTKENNSTLKTVSLMMIITLVGKILGLVREQFLAGNFGFAMAAGAFLTASRIPRLFFDAVFASAISASFIPVFNEYLKERGKEAAFRLSNNFITLIGLITVALTLVGIYFAPMLANWFADGFDAETLALCTQLLRYLFPTIIFTGTAFSFVGILQSMDEFNIPAAMSIVSNLVIIVYYLFFIDVFGIYGLTAAFLIGWALQAVIQIPPLRKRGYRYRPVLDLKDEGLGKIFKLMLPVMVGTWIQPINLAINIKFASRFLTGAGVNAIEYANTVYSIIAGVFVLSIVNVIFPKLSQQIIAGQREEFSHTLSVTIETMMFFLIPMTAGLMCLAGPVIQLVYQRGAFGVYETEVTGVILFYFSIGIIGFGLQNVFSRAFYAQKNGRIPLISGIISIIINIVLCICLSPRMGVGGLALASALALTVSAAVLLVPLQKDYKILNRELLTGLLKMCIAAGVMAAGVILARNTVYSLLGGGFMATVILAAVSVGAGIIIYSALCSILRLPQMKLLLTYINKLKKGRKVND